MTPLLFTLLVLAVAVAAGIVGALLGLGGGIVVVPALTLLFGIDIRFAIGASIVAVIATSTGSAAAYVRERLTNLRVAMLLELTTTAGAICGAWLAGRIGGRWLFLCFGLVLLYAAVTMLRGNGDDDKTRPVPPDALADRLRLHGDFWDPAVGRRIRYRVCHTRLGLALSYGAGVISGLLGVGGGIMKVPAMHLAMRLPMKISTATSNFMIGVTAAASAGVYFMRGDIDPFIAAPVAIGVLLGARAGSRLLARVNGRAIRIGFIVVLLWVAAQMLLRGVRG